MGSCFKCKAIINSGSRCSACKNEYAREYRLRNKERDREKLAKKAREYRAKHGDKQKQKRRLRYLTSRDKILQRNRKYDEAHQSRRQQYNKAYRQNNKAALAPKEKCRKRAYYEG